MEMKKIEQAVPLLPALSRVLLRYERAQVEGFIEIAIALLDFADDDPDVELNGDELDGTGSEDDFCGHSPSGPGCPVADPDAAADDVPCDEPHQDLEEEAHEHPDYAFDQTDGPLPSFLSDDATLRKPHRDRIRAERCICVPHSRLASFRFATEVLHGEV